MIDPAGTRGDDPDEERGEDSTRPAADATTAEHPDTVEAEGRATRSNERLTHRSVRSFVIRGGRLTGAQGEALERLLPRYGLPFTDAPLVPERVFGRRAPLWLEIGFGDGEALLDMAAARPEVDFLGCEVHAPGVGRALLGIERLGLENVRVVQHDVMEVLASMLPPASLERVLLFFPDPWHKKRHHKRRLVRREFLDAVARSLAPGGILHCATDWRDYAEWMLERIEPDPRFDNLAGPGRSSPRPEWRTLTRFERRGERLGHEVTDLLYRRRPD